MTEQRRLVTVVFADVVGSTALAEELDAEDVRVLFTRYYALANEVVTAHGGIVAKLLGDGVLAVFGVPVAHGDDAQRALDAALRLRDAVSRDTALQRLQLRIGVNTGEVLANEDASGEIVGDAVNVAARVAAAAGEGEILAADVTHRAAPAIAYGEAREISAKGKAQPVRVWPVLGGPAERAAETPFVGREDDLAQLDLVARRAFQGRRPHLVTITAPQGIGKSRLVDQFAGRLGESVQYAHAHCPPYGATLAYGPLRDLLIDILGVSAEAPADDVRRQIGAILDGRDADRDAQIVTLTVAPEGAPGEEEKERVILAWRRLFARAASERPLLIALEDLQNASDTLLDLIEQVAQPDVAAPLLVVCLARPELLTRRPAWGGGRRNSLNLSLEPLRNEEIGLLIARLFEAEPPPELTQLIVDRAAGNPFFAEELVRSLFDRGSIDMSDPAAVRRALVALPETVQATLLARIDMLPGEERDVLQAAAVVGRAFTAGQLRSISAVGEADIERVLGRLAERELITRSDGGEYAFRNLLIRDVAYGMLPRARRSRDHALIARHLEASADQHDELAGLIGSHYLEATRLRRASAVPIDIPGVDPEATRAGAVRWLSRASELNNAAGAWSEAIAQITDAVTLASDDDERMRLLMQSGDTQYGGDDGWDSLIESRRLWRASTQKEPALGARILTKMLLVVLRSGVSVSPDRLPDEPEQIRMASEALELAERSGDEFVLASARVPHALLERARPSRTRESLERARREAEDAAVVLERRAEWNVWSVALDTWAAIQGDLGDLRGARAVAVRRLEVEDRLPWVERAHAHWTIPIYDMALGDSAGARDHASLVLSLPTFSEDAERIAMQSLVGLVFVLSLRAAARWALGDWDGVLEDARLGLVATGRMGEVPMQAVYEHTGIAALYVARRRERADLVAEFGPTLRRWVSSDRALALLEDDPAHLDGVLARVADAGIDTWQVERSLSLAAAYGHVPAEPERLDTLVTDAASRGLRPLEAQLRRLRARAKGDVADARRAHELLVECGMRADAALAGIEAAALGDRAFLARARAELERLGDLRGLAAADALR